MNKLDLDMLIVAKRLPPYHGTGGSLVREIAGDEHWPTSRVLAAIRRLVSRGQAVRDDFPTSPKVAYALDYRVWQHVTEKGKLP